MEEYVFIIIAAYFAAISLFAVILTIHDKRAAQNHSWRIKEQTLFLTAFLGGSLAMLLTMRSIRHKTKHTAFMVGIPAIIVLQIAVAAFIWLSIYNGVFIFK